MNIPIILGTGREGRRSESVALFMAQEAGRAGHESEILDARDYSPAFTDGSGEGGRAKALAEKLADADALIIVTPEYNHGYPGELKLMLDLLYKEYRGKPLGICGVSSGPLGGARAVEQLRLVAVELRMPLAREALYFASVGELFGESGKMKEPGPWEKRAAKLFEELSSLAR